MPLTVRAVAITQDNQMKTFSVYYNVLSPSTYKQLLRREGDEIDELRRRSELNDHTCTLVHRDGTDDLDATLALYYLHNSTPSGRSRNGGG
jgi:hypothetical protein